MLSAPVELGFGMGAGVAAAVVVSCWSLCNREKGPLGGFVVTGDLDPAWIRHYMPSAQAELGCDE
jgi:hypothetical protein